jgi:hypothetical protein
MANYRTSPLGLGLKKPAAEDNQYSNQASDRVLQEDSMRHN